MHYIFPLEILKLLAHIETRECIDTFRIYGTDIS